MALDGWRQRRWERYFYFIGAAGTSVAVNYRRDNRRNSQEIEALGGKAIAFSAR